MNNHGLALEHALCHLPAAVLAVNTQRDVAFVVGMARANDGNREAFLAVHLHQEFLPRNLVAGVFPIGVRERRALGNAVVRKRLLVGARGTDVHELLGLALE